MLDALDYSHRAGIIHRDIKPANVMLTPAGDVKVMDFGIARAIADSSATMTQTAAVVGTAQYLSPEQARGEQVDARSDLYSAGCLLFELLTGRPPFVGDSPVSVAYQHVREEAPAAVDDRPRDHAGDRRDHAEGADQARRRALPERVGDARRHRPRARGTPGAWRPPSTGRPDRRPSTSCRRHRASRADRGHAGRLTPRGAPTEAAHLAVGRLLLLLLVAAVIAALIVIAEPASRTTRPPTTEVPEIVGHHARGGQQALEDADLVLGDEITATNDGPQEPHHPAGATPGETVDEGTAVDYTISCRREDHGRPDVTDMNLAERRHALEGS